MSDFPSINTGETGSTRTFTQVFADEFDEDGPGPGPNFVYDTLDDALNRTGNSGQETDGTLVPLDEDGDPIRTRSVEGKRWAAYTNGPNDEFVFRRDGLLYVGGKVENKTDPTRRNVQRAGQDYNWNEITPYAPYMVQMLRHNEPNGALDENGNNIKVVDFENSPGIAMSPGHFIEMRLSVEQMRTESYRMSLWLTPDPPNESDMYDDDPRNGVEIDIFEIENAGPGYHGNNRIQCKCLGGLAGKTEPQNGGNIDLFDHDIDITTGFFTVGLLWLRTGLYWYVNGKEVIRELALVPYVDMVLSLTRELNSGTKDVAEFPDDVIEDGPHQPYDYGLYGFHSYPHLDRIDECFGRVDYLRIWSVDGENAVFRGANSQGDSGGAQDATPVTGVVTQSAVDTTQGIRFAPGLVAGEHRYELKDPSLANTGTFNYSDYGADAILISGERGPTLRLQVSAVEDNTSRVVTFELDDIETLEPVVITFENVDPDGNYESA